MSGTIYAVVEFERGQSGCEHCSEPDHLELVAAFSTREAAEAHVEFIKTTEYYDNWRNRLEIREVAFNASYAKVFLFNIAKSSGKPHLDERYKRGRVELLSTVTEGFGRYTPFSGKGQGGEYLIVIAANEKDARARAERIVKEKQNG